MSEPNGYSIGKEPNKPRVDALIARSKANAEKKKYSPPQKGVTPPGLIPFVKGGPRPQNSRSKLNAKFMSALVDDFEAHGKRAIERMRIHDPSGYIKTVAFLMPKQFEQTTPMQDLTDEELERGIEYLKSKLAVSDGKGNRTAPLLSAPIDVQALPEAD